MKLFTSPRVRSASAAAMVLAVGTAVLVPTTASASASASAATATATASQTGDPREHCWQEVDSGRSMCGSSLDDLAEKVYLRYGVILGERPGEDLPSSVTAPSTRAKKKVDAARGSVEDEPGARVSYLLVRGYTDRNYRGISMTWSSTLKEPPCRYIGSLPYGQYEYLYAQNWNDTMSSYQVASGCKLTVWEHSVFRGTKRGPYGNSPDLGLLNKKVSSMSLRKES